MKKLALAIVLTFSMTAQADIFDVINFFDVTKFIEATITTFRGIAINLEKVRVIQQKQLDVKEQWDLVCESTHALQKDLTAFNKELVAAKVNQEHCLPITTVIAYNLEILKNCENYYSKPVPENFETLLKKWNASLFQTRMLYIKCYPATAKIKFPIPGLPGAGK